MEPIRNWDLNILDMIQQTKSNQKNLYEGPIAKKIIIFAIPLMISNMLQLVFNAADMIVVGKFDGKEALAAIGSTSSLIMLLTSMVTGLSIGANVLVGHAFGANDKAKLNRVIHNAITICILLGIVLSVIGIVFSGNLLQLMGSPEDVIGLSALYMRIYFIGIPALCLYNFGASILRGMGDTRHSLNYLIIAGIINVFFNIFFVAVLSLGVAGVAIATVISQFISAILVLRCLAVPDEQYRLSFSKLGIQPDMLILIAKIGVPAAINMMVYGISNVLIQSSVNSFGSTVIAGNTASNSIEQFVYCGMMALSNAAQSFVSQNIGAGRYENVKKTAILCIVYDLFLWIVMGCLCLIFKEQLLSLYESDKQVIYYGCIRMKIILSTYFTNAVMDVMVGCIRGMGNSIAPTILMIFGVCGVRVLWIYTVFAKLHTLQSLYLSYPVSWIITSIAQLILFCSVYRRCIRMKIACE